MSREVTILGGPKSEETVVIDERCIFLNMAQLPPIRWSYDDYMSDKPLHSVGVDVVSYRIQPFKVGNRRIWFAAHPCLDEKTVDGYAGDLLYAAWQNRERKRNR